MYRIAEEAVTNAAKHSSSDHIEIDFTKINDLFNLIIKDNGKGFTEILGNTSGLGMHTMKYRANMIGASLDIKSVINKGTLVACTLKTPNLNV